MVPSKSNSAKSMAGSFYVRVLPSALPMKHRLPFTIRDARPDDAAAIVRVMNPIIAAGIYTAFDTPWTTDTEAEYIRAFPARGVFLVAISQADDRLVGFQSMEPFATYTRAFDHVGVLGTYVALDCRRQGIASQLFEATFVAAARKGYEKIFTFVRADNPAALETYIRQGFRAIGTARRHARIGGRYIDEIVIEKLFPGTPFASSE
jgi:L-amino acid N-acyltransferase YncA